MLIKRLAIAAHCASSDQSHTQMSQLHLCSCILQGLRNSSAQRLLVCSPGRTRCPWSASCVTPMRSWLGPGTCGRGPSAESGCAPVHSQALHPDAHIHIACDSTAHVPNPATIVLRPAAHDACATLRTRMSRTFLRQTRQLNNRTQIRQIARLQRRNAGSGGQRDQKTSGNRITGDHGIPCASCSRLQDGACRSDRTLQVQQRLRGQDRRIWCSAGL